MADLRPDILVLNEALFCRQYVDRAVDYARLFDFPYQAAALYDEAWGNAILSRHRSRNRTRCNFTNVAGWSRRSPPRQVR